MNELDSIRRWQAGESSSREVSLRDGLPVSVREGGALSYYTFRAGELVEIREPNGVRLAYGYGADGRLLSVDRDDRRWADYAYDVEGRLSHVTRPEGTFSYAYDARGRLVRSLRGDAGAVSYDWQSERVASARTDREQSCFEYDADGQLIGLAQEVEGRLLSLRFRFERARLARISFVEWNQDIDFSWDERGRPAHIAWNGREVVRFGTDDDARVASRDSCDGVREQTWHERVAGRPQRQVLRWHDRDWWSSELVRDGAFRLLRQGERSFSYDDCGRLGEACEGGQRWQYRYDEQDNPLDVESFELDAAGRVRTRGCGTGECVLRYNDCGELAELLRDGERVARCVYDHKGRLLLKTSPAGTERYIYGADDGLLAIADGAGKPRLIFLRSPLGIEACIDFRRDPTGEVLCLHHDVHGTLLFVGGQDGPLTGPFASDPFGTPLASCEGLPYFFRGRMWHADLRLYRIGCRWYDPELRQFLTPDTYTGAPDDERLVNPFRNAREQRMARAQILSDWLRRPRLRNRRSYCENDPVNRFDPDGHWSFGGVLLSLVGVLWTLPNTAFGLAVEVSCLIGEVVRWLVWLFSAGHVSWQTPGFDVAASGHLNAFALVFKGGWLGSFQSLLGITFGNVIIVNGEYQNHPAWQALPDPVSPPAYHGAVSIPKSQALYEHELRHVNQYGWWGPFFHLGMPIFGIYEWDVILHGYQNASFERDAREHGGL